MRFIASSPRFSKFFGNFTSGQVRNSGINSEHNKARLRCSGFDLHLKPSVSVCLLYFILFFLGLMRLGLGYRQLLGNIVSFGDIQAKT